MTTLSYCKGLPTPESEMNALGCTSLEMFLEAYTPIFHRAACETVRRLQSESEFDKSAWNTHLQKAYGISKRHANGVISFAAGAVDSAKGCRSNHLKQLQGKLKSTQQWLKAAAKS